MTNKLTHKKDIDYSWTTGSDVDPNYNLTFKLNDFTELIIKENLVSPLVPLQVWQLV